MMQTPIKSPKRKAPKFVGIKVLILALSGAITIGFWNLLSTNAFQATTPPAVVTLSAQPPANVGQDLPPMPTIVPLVKVSAPQASDETVPAALPQNVPGTSSQLVDETVPLRVVAAPTIVVVQKSKPVIGAQASSPATTSGGGGGGSSKSGSKPKTKSSK
jgi:hypothetical protein